MRAISQNTQGLSLLIELNWDRLLFVTAIGAALAASAYMGSL